MKKSPLLFFHYSIILCNLIALFILIAQILSLYADNKRATLWDNHYTIAISAEIALKPITDQLQQHGMENIIHYYNQNISVATYPQITNIPLSHIHDYLIPNDIRYTPYIKNIIQLFYDQDKQYHLLYIPKTISIVTLFFQLRTILNPITQLWYIVDFPKMSSFISAGITILFLLIFIISIQSHRYFFVISSPCFIAISLYGIPITPSIVMLPVYLYMGFVALKYKLYYSSMYGRLSLFLFLFIIVITYIHYTAMHVVILLLLLLLLYYMVYAYIRIHYPPHSFWHLWKKIIPDDIVPHNPENTPPNSLHPEQSLLFSIHKKQTIVPTMLQKVHISESILYFIPLIILCVILSTTLYAQLPYIPHNVTIVQPQKPYQLLQYDSVYNYLQSHSPTQKTIPTIAHYIKHEMYQENIFYGTQYIFPQKNTTITTQNYELHGTQEVKITHTIINKFSDKWFTQHIHAILQTNIAYLLSNSKKNLFSLVYHKTNIAIYRYYYLSTLSLLSLLLIIVYNKKNHYALRTST